MVHGFFVFDKKGFQSNQDKRISLDSKTKNIPGVVDSKCNKDTNTKRIWSVKNNDKTDWINLDYQDKLNQHCITNFVG